MKSTLILKLKFTELGHGMRDTNGDARTVPGQCQNQGHSAKIHRFEGNWGLETISEKVWKCCGSLDL
jgi:hypothetical protein